MKFKNILITGGTGFVGSNLTRRLVNMGYQPSLIIRKQSNRWRLKDIIDKINWIEADLTDYQKLKRNLKQFHPEYIYHLAAYGTNQTTENDIQKSLYTNIQGSLNLAKICCNLGFKYFVNTGSSSEYGINYEPMKEEDILKPINFYGVSKASQTLGLNAFLSKYRFPNVTLRLFSPYGYYESLNKFISSVILGYFKGIDLNLSRRNYVRDFIFIDDVVDAYLYFLKGKKYYGEIFNIGSGKQTKLGEVIKLIEQISKKQVGITWNTYKSNQVEPISWKANIGKAKKYLNWQPKVNLYKGLTKTYIWYKNTYDKSK